MIDRSKDWVHYLTRPFTLLGASLWQRWYDSDEIKTLLGVTTPDALFLEEHQNVVRYYRDKEQLSLLRSTVERIVREDSPRLKAIFNKGFEMNARAQAILDKGPDALSGLGDAVHMIIDLGLHATVVPNLSLPFIDSLEQKDMQLQEMTEKLRGLSLYPRFNSEIVIPHVARVFEQNGLNPSFAFVSTLQELENGDFVALADRLAEREAGKRFIYKVSHDKEDITWVSDINSVVREREHIPQQSPNFGLKGQIAYPGKVKGVARLVLTDNPGKVYFEEGDVLVSINSTPALMPIIQKASAIVTDEGGIACHAAIVSRELKKPCIMGTKYATSIIKDGDMVEVDANNGIVRIIK